MVKLKQLSIPTASAVITLIILLNIFDLHTDIENRTLLLIFNSLFMGIVPIAVSLAAAGTYLNKKMAGAFLMSCGLLILGLGSISSACLRLLGSTDNVSVTVFNICAFASGLLHLFAANRYQYSVFRHQNGRVTITAMFAAATVFVTAVIITACLGLLPVFIDINGSTEIRNDVMFLAIGFFFASFLFFFRQYKKRRDDFFYWYALSLLMLAAGLFGVTIAQGVGSLSGWAGRLAQYVSGCFALLSMVSMYRKARGANQKTAEIMAKFFSNPEENYQNLVNSSADPILSVDQAGRILLYNPRTVSMFQLNEVGVLNSSVYALLAPTDAERLRADIGIFRDTGCSIIVGQTVEMTATDTLGNAFPIEVSISGRRLIDNVVVTLIMRDITVRRKHDEALIREERCSRTLVEELRKADELKNTFISVLSHEIRNPLSAMSAGLSLLETTEDQAIVNRTREILRRQTGQLCRLVDDLLEVTRITQGKIRLKKELADICRLTLNIAEDYRLQYELKGVDLSVRLPDAALIAMADTLRLSQCISNLLNNALKYTQPGGAVHLSLEHGENEAIITVADNGRGIDPANLPNLFSFFAQVENASETSPRGLGLGLAIAKGFTELHGGSIMAFSEGIGKGSVFTVRIPAAAAETAASACEESIQETYKKQAAAAVKE